MFPRFCRFDQDLGDELHDSDANMARKSGSTTRKQRAAARRKRTREEESDEEDYSDDGEDEDEFPPPKDLPQFNPQQVKQLQQLMAAMKGANTAKLTSSEESAPDKILIYAGFPSKGDDQDRIPTLIRAAIQR